MRILFVCSSKSSNRSSSYVHRILQLEQHCRKLGAETSLLFLGDLFFGSPTVIQPLNIPFVFRYLKRFDVVSAGGNGSAYFFALAKPLIGRGILVYDVHGDGITESRVIRNGRFDLAGYFNAFQMRLTEYVGFNGADFFIAASHRLKQRLLARDRRLKAKDVEVILNGVDVESFKPQKEETHNMLGNDFIVTYAGSFRRWQGTANLIRAAEILSSEDVHFKFIGFGKHDSDIKKEIQKKLGNKATLLDWLSKTELLAELQKSDVLIIPADVSSREQAENRAFAFPTKFAEFLAIAKPVISTRIDESSTLVERFDCGFVCEPTPESIAETIMKARETPRETLLLKGLNGRRLAETELDINLICKKYLQFLNRVLKERGTNK